MEDIGPYEMFSPIHLACLQRMHAEGLEVVPADLDSIERNHPDATQDPLFIEYRRRAVADLLRRRPGRKAASFGTYARLWFAKQEIEDEVKAKRARRRAGTETRLYNADPPGLQAANFVAREFYFHCTGRALLNRISKERIR